MSEHTPEQYINMTLIDGVLRLPNGTSIEVSVETLLAAPTLLEALEGMIDTESMFVAQLSTEARIEFGPEGTMWDQVLRTARGAVAQAKGETS